MGYGFGLAPDAQGNGTTPDDLQQVLWGLYDAGKPAIVSGLKVSGRSDMTYAVTAGVAAIPTSSVKVVLVPIAAVNVSTTAAPSSGTRTDYISVGLDGAVSVSTTKPTDRAIIDVRTVPANITATTATTSTLGNRLFAPLRGGMAGEVVYWSHGVANGTAITDALGFERTMMTRTFTLDTDRRLDFALQASYEMSRPANTYSWGWKTSTFVWSVWLDGVRRWSVELGIEEFPETKFASTTFGVPEGTHTVELRRERRLLGTDDHPNDRPIYRSGGTENWPGTVFKIVDMGAVA